MPNKQAAELHQRMVSLGGFIAALRWVEAYLVQAGVPPEMIGAIQLERGKAEAIQRGIEQILVDLAATADPPPG
jgi:hypothetical protein